MLPRYKERVCNAHFGSAFPHSTTPVTNRTPNYFNNHQEDSTNKSEHFTSDMSRARGPFELVAATEDDVTLCPVHKRVVSDRGQSDVPGGPIPGDPGQSWACLEDTSSGLTRPLDVKTRLRAPETSHRTESPYRLLSHATSGRSHSVSRTPPPMSNRSFGNDSSSAPKLHPRLKKDNNITVAHVHHSSLTNDNNERGATESRNLFHDNSGSQYSLDELDALRGHRCPTAASASPPIVNVQPMRSYAATHARNNNDYSECPLEILDRKRSHANSSVITAPENAHVTGNENNVNLEVVCQKFLMCPKCGLCRGMCCERKLARLPRTYVGRQEVSARCAIDWCTCMACAAKVLSWIPKVPDDVADYDEKKLRDMPCACCAARNYQLWCCCLRWTAVGLMCLPCLPCLAAFWPLRGLERACARCCRRPRPKGCRCKAVRRDVVVDPTEFWINSEDSVDESDPRT